LFAAVVAPVLVTGAGLPALSGVLPMLNAGPLAAIGVFLGLTMVFLLLVYIVTAAVMGRVLKRA
ncbi:MAG: hypothetical protein KJP02_01290, partial [Octadecabacter sp.]|nr:hypothetical protein [Octadecabacter sp.]